MTEQNDVAKAISLLRQTLPEMNKRNIAATPENYAVWYEYVNGQNDDLSRAVRELESGNVEFTPEIHRDLYSKYIASARESAVNQLSESVRQIINQFLEKIGLEGLSLSEYAQTLNEFSDQVSQADNFSAINHLVAQLLEETHKRETASREIQASVQMMATEMKKLRAEVARLNAESTTDSLTRVNNRRAFDSDIENAIAVSKMEDSGLCLLLLDIDHFRQFNETHGQTVGDKVLRFVATLLKKNIKGNDSVARFGGEEFAILLPDTDYNGALAVAENVRDKLAKQTLSDSEEKKQLGTITISVGVASYQNGESPDELLSRAGKCLQQAKQTGRNRVVGEREVTPRAPSNETFI